ncbi:flagellar hook-basal body complex protein FliE [Microvirga roseola]|uniref:flagellar hook-basal body complex protein FliE n=1 Tax=Microvirga roseola TaxID=2883126 RepID=UPI001E5DD8A0|nr:flagellar hook-basal body complex protein FliE [Microvirga roseola]
MVNAVSAISSMIDRTGGVAATQTVATHALAGAGAGAGVAGASQASFGDMMAQVASTAIDTMKAGEAAAISGIQGKASVQQVVEAVMSAEQTLQAAIAIRDKVIAAYQEISRMAI